MGLSQELARELVPALAQGLARAARRRALLLQRRERARGVFLVQQAGPSGDDAARVGVECFTERDAPRLSRAQTNLQSRESRVPALVAQERVRVLVVDVPAPAALVHVLVALRADTMPVRDVPRAAGAPGRLSRARVRLDVERVQANRQRDDAVDGDWKRDLGLRRVGVHLTHGETRPDRSRFRNRDGSRNGCAVAR